MLDNAGARISPLPSGLAQTPPGPVLGTVLAGVRREECNGFELEELARARRRQIAWLEAECLADVAAVALTPPGAVDGPAERAATVQPHVVGLLEALFGWSSCHAGWYLDLALGLDRLPRTRAALAAGELDLAQARIIAERLSVLTDVQRRQAEDVLFPAVIGMAASLLRLRVERVVIQIDPHAAAERHRRAYADRSVELTPAIDSVADLRLHGIPADQAVEAFAHVDAIARSVKAAGDHRTLPQLRADIATTLLSGTRAFDSPPHTVSPDGLPPDLPPATGNDRDGSQHTWALHEGADRDGQVRAGLDPDHVVDDLDQPADTTRAVSQPVLTTPAVSQPADTMSRIGSSCTTLATTGQAGHVSGIAVEPDTSTSSDTRTGISTSSGTRTSISAGSGTGTGTGTGPPRDREPRQARGQTEPGRPLSRREVSGWPRRVRAKIQLTVPLTVLAGLSEHPGELGGVGPVVAEVARRTVANHLHNPDAMVTVAVTDPATGRLVALHPIQRRFLRGLKAELVEALNHTCTWMTCRRPANTCELDHVTGYADGGTTSVANQAVLCKPHHTVKTRAGWRLEHLTPGAYRFTDPHGRTYTTTPPSLTDPAPPPHAPLNLTDPAPPPRHPPPTPAEADAPPR